MTHPVFPSDEAPDLLQHLALERVSVQWAGFLGALSDELQSQLADDEYRALLVRLGSRFAQSHELPACASLSEVETAANRVWAGLKWGFAEFSDYGRQLQINHHACPLPAALQVDAELAGGFLEGAYGTWLAAAGAPAELELKQLQSSGLPMHMAFELAAR